jgi:hypothetical protein
VIVYFLLLVLVFELIGDYLSCMYHHAREREHIPAQVVISMTLQGLTWVPIGVALYTGSTLYVALVSILGTGIGTLLGALHARARKRC